MANFLPAAAVGQFNEQGFVAPVAALPPDDAEHYRLRLERASAAKPEIAQRVLKMKSHMVFGCLDELVRLPAILDAVESLLGPDILVWTSSLFAKSPGSPDFVSWHQDVAYWGLDPPDIVTAWVAFTDSRPDNGCMQVVPGTHKLDIVAHRDTFAANNMLSRGQEVAVDIDEAKAVNLVLEPGEMSLHHSRIVHGSHANRSRRARIGFAIRYISPAVRQSAGAEDSVMLVRGKDRHQHFLYDPRPRADFDCDALAAYEAVCERSRRFLLPSTSNP
jgi:ectoine hydroxylase-related dioxygenase (phytanoyl-CoA dioxygenase family)